MKVWFKTVSPCFQRTCCIFFGRRDYLFVPSGPLHSSSLHAVAYSSTTPTRQKCLGQWFSLIVKCLQAGQWASWCFWAMRWPSGFVMGQLWWREPFYCAVSLYVWPLPEYKCLGQALKGPARASLPHTALQAILTQVRTRRHRHTQQNIHPSTGEQPHIQSQGPLPALHTQANHHQPGESPKQKPRAQMSLPHKQQTCALVQMPPKKHTCLPPSDSVNTSMGPHSLLPPFHLVCNPSFTYIYTSISVHPLVFLRLSPRISWSPSPCLRLPSPPPARALMPRTREPQPQLPPARPPRPESPAWDPTEWVTAALHSFSTESGHYFLI